MLHRYKEFIKAVSGNAEKEEELKEIVCDAVEKIKHYCPEEFWATVYKMHCVAYGPHFDEKLARMAVGKMRNVDGSAGEHWTIEQTSQIADQYGIVHKADWYYVMNMLYSDFAQVIGNDSNTYAKMAKAYMQDPDAPEGKVLNLWLTQIKSK
ncbi:MAG: hypothetical protein DBY32_04215 [Phascolarctobacterium sp.]|nr:MAG: hypothetical protein DBY32_04215 [Phascolarctobacterium sp.]